MEILAVKAYTRTDTKKALDVSEKTQRIESSIFVLLKFKNRFLKQPLQNPNSFIFRQVFA